MRLEDYMATVGVDGNMLHIVGYLVENEMTRDSDGEYWVLIQEVTSARCGSGAQRVGTSTAVSSRMESPSCQRICRAW